MYAVCASLVHINEMLRLKFASLFDFFSFPFLSGDRRRQLGANVATILTQWAHWAPIERPFRKPNSPLLSEWFAYFFACLLAFFFFLHLACMQTGG